MRVGQHEAWEREGLQEREGESMGPGHAQAVEREERVHTWEREGESTDPEPHVCAGSREGQEGAAWERGGECALWVCTGSREGREGACMGGGGCTEREGGEHRPQA